MIASIVEFLFLALVGKRFLIAFFAGIGAALGWSSFIGGDNVAFVAIGTWAVVYLGLLVKLAKSPSETAKQTGNSVPPAA